MTTTNLYSGRVTGDGKVYLLTDIPASRIHDVRARIQAKGAILSVHGMVDLVPAVLPPVVRLPPNNRNRKPVRHIESGVVYESAEMAAQEFNISIASVRLSCRKNRPTSAGDVFEFYKRNVNE